VTGYGPPDDPSEAPTGYYDYSGQGDPERGAPWYRNPIVLIALGLFAAILLGVAVYFLADQTHGTSGTTQTPTSPTTSISVTSTTTTEAPTTTTEPVAPAPTTTMTVEPTTTAPTTTAPTTTPPTSTTPDEGHHHHHHGTP
jgi:cytoskeletal protein RodZ